MGSVSLQIAEEGPGSLSEYGKLPIRFRARERLDLSGPDSLRALAVDPFEKDYDAYPDSSPVLWGRTFDLTNWGILAAFQGEARIGGAVVAFRTPGVDMLEGRDDLAIVWDFRVAPEWQGMGVGRALWSAAEEWARDRGATELRVETQDVNLGACRFYTAMGCRILRIDPDAYPDLPDEVQILWTKTLK